MSQENSEPYININLTSEPEKHDQEQTPEKNNIDIICIKTGKHKFKILICLHRI